MRTRVLMTFDSASVAIADVGVQAATTYEIALIFVPFLITRLVRFSFF